MEFIKAVRVNLVESNGVITHVSNEGHSFKVPEGWEPVGQRICDLPHGAENTQTIGWYNGKAIYSRKWECWDEQKEITLYEMGDEAIKILIQQFLELDEETICRFIKGLNWERITELLGFNPLDEDPDSTDREIAEFLATDVGEQILEDLEQSA